MACCVQYLQLCKDASPPLVALHEHGDGREVSSLLNTICEPVSCTLGFGGTRWAGHHVAVGGRHCRRAFRLCGAETSVTTYDSRGAWGIEVLALVKHFASIVSLSLGQIGVSKKTTAPFCVSHCACM